VRICPNLPAGPSLPAGYSVEGLAGSLSPGVNVADVFDPAFEFEVGNGWGVEETADSVGIRNPPKRSLSFANPLYVYDPSNPSEPKEVPAPENAKEWLSWFQSHPNLETSKPVPVSVGGASGMQIDVTASSKLENYSRKICSKKPCIPLYPTGGGPIFAQPSGTGKDRYVIVDVRGQTVIINVVAPPGKFDAFAPKAKKVLASVEWTPATNKRANMIVWAGLQALGRPSIPSGLRIDPRPPITPGDNATHTAPPIVKSTLSHAIHLHPLLGKCPLGNIRSESTIQPGARIHTQDSSQPSTSPAGRELGCTSRA
jgi:hypothetical protein